MSLALIPQPKNIRRQAGAYRIRAGRTIAISDGALWPEAERARRLFRGSRVTTAVPGVPADVRLALVPGKGREAYRVDIAPAGVRLEAGSVAGISWGLATLEQIAAQSPAGVLPALRVDDEPDFADRGVYYDVARGRVPTLQSLLDMADTLSRFKINQLQLYIEHTFRFAGHPEIGRGASPLTAEDIVRLDAHCAARHVELVPSLASFGHLATVLNHPKYRHLAEDWGVGRYASPDAAKLPAWQRRKGWALSPANPEIYRFLDSLFAEFLPLFRSRRFNVCCDETWDLGLGQSYRLCRRRGKGRVYLDHIKRLRDLAGKYGKTILFWGDIIRHHPELIPEIPRDVTVLDWAYRSSHDFDSIRDFRRAGVPFYACPGTSSWVSLFPRLPEAAANIHGFAAAGRRHGAQGLLNTDWGDGGHYNFMEYSWHGYVFGAEQAWNTDADRTTFTPRFARCFLGSADPELARAVDALGDVSHLSVYGCYQSVWQHILFRPPGDPLFGAGSREASVAERGKIRATKIALDAARGRKAAARLARIRSALVSAAGEPGADPHGVLPYWVFAVDTMACAARKLAAFGVGGRDTPGGRRRLRREMAGLMRRFERLWMRRNRRAEIRITLRRYRAAIAAML